MRTYSTRERILITGGAGLAKRVKARILQASTSEVYGAPQVRPVSPAMSPLINARVIDPLE